MIPRLLRSLRLWRLRYERDILIADIARVQADHRVLVPRWRQRVSDLQKRILLAQSGSK